MLVTFCEVKVMEVLNRKNYFPYPPEISVSGQLLFCPYFAQRSS